MGKNTGLHQNAERPKHRQNNRQRKFINKIAASVVASVSTVPMHLFSRLKDRPMVLIQVIMSRLFACIAVVAIGILISILLGSVGFLLPFLTSAVILIYNAFSLYRLIVNGDYVSFDGHVRDISGEKIRSIMPSFMSRILRSKTKSITIMSNEGPFKIRAHQSLGNFQVGDYVRVYTSSEERVLQTSNGYSLMNYIVIEQLTREDLDDAP